MGHPQYLLVDQSMLLRVCYCGEKKAPTFLPRPQVVGDELREYIDSFTSHTPLSLPLPPPLTCILSLPQ